MSDTTDGGTVRDERTLREESIAARLAEVKVIAMGVSEHLARAIGGYNVLTKKLGELASLIGEPSTEDLQRALTRMKGGADDGAVQKPRIITEG